VDTDQRQQGEVHQASGSGVLRSPVVVMTHLESTLEGPLLGQVMGFCIGIREPIFCIHFGMPKARNGL
jgi:hypothetical protein